MVERRKGRARRAPEQTRVLLPFLVALVALRARRPRRSHIVGSAMARRSVGEVMGGTQPRAQSVGPGEEEEVEAPVVLVVGCPQGSSRKSSCRVVSSLESW